MLNFSNNLHKTRCMGVFGVVDWKFDIRNANFKIADTRWRLFYSNFELFEQLTQHTLYGYFLGRWLRFWSQNWKIQNLVSELQNSKWRIQDGDYVTLMLNFSNNLHKTRCMGVFGVADRKFDVRIANFKIADTRWRLFYSNFEVFEQLTQNLLYEYFLGRWLRFWSQNWEIQNLVSEL